MSVAVRDQRLKNWGLSALGTALVLVIWQLATGTFRLVDDVVLPSPLEVLNEAIRIQDLIVSNFWPTVTASAVGFVLAVTGGILGAVALSYDERIRTGLMPLIIGGNSIPRVSLAPVIIYYFGGFQAKYMLSAWIAFFPMLVNTLEGLSALDDDRENLLRTLGASTWQEYRYLRIPSALPLIFDGMKISVSLAIVGAVVGEFIGAREGLGYLALFALRDVNTSLVMASIFAMSIVSVAAFFALFLIQDRVIHWKEANLFTE